MGQIITRGTRLIKVIDLSDTAKGEVSIEQVSEISHDASRETDERRYEDSIVANVVFEKSLTGNITLKGDLEHYCTPGYAATVRTDPLFEPNHYYLLRFLSLNIMSGVTKMLYHRYICQLKDFPKLQKSAGEITDKEVVLAVALYTGGADISYDFEKPYIATADGDPGPIDATPTDDYNPLFDAEVSDTTKTLTAAETEIGTLTNPC